MTNKVSTTEYHIVFDTFATSDRRLMICTSVEQARKYRDKFNKNTELTKKYGKVHIEKVVITTEVIK